ncbi:exo-alpha-sialidase [Sphingobacterium sp. SGG-5]|uniref:sialidase family protein n=1 Tax=Sphingobacterium sp. SGG-5 TaxID=2710881 RepID=UPI0013EC655A|nr:sialidase family protein [Sphingobacterium sp. SGG-5]NGM62148.1 exo-alpha-sialidase [Sphingobacterium sp. SGG-5]
MMKKSKWFVLFTLLILFISGSQSYSQTDIVPGVVIAHSPKSSGKYLGTPSIVILPNGEYLASFDFFGPKSTSDVVHVYKSLDRGVTWQFLTELEDTFWAGLFVVKSDVYLLGVRGSDRNLSIRKSSDMGKTWSSLVVLKKGRYHGSSTPVVFHDGKIYKGYDHLGVEDKKKPWMSENKSFVMWADTNADLLKTDSWSYSEEVEKPHDMDGTGWLETNAVLGPDGLIKGITRVANESGYIAGYYSVGEDGSVDPDSVKAIPFLGGATKFNIMWDVKTKKYWALTNYPSEILRKPKMRAGGMRSVLALISSPDLAHWKLNQIILASDNVKYHGFQYIDWRFEGDDIVFVNRVGFTDEFGEADNAHNSNYITFQRIHNYAKSGTDRKWRKYINK